jgi:tetratricopeptide (TPR) repeat protein
MALGLASGLTCASEAAFVKQGELLMAQRKYDAAIQQFMQALEKNPRSPRAHLNLGRVYRAQQRYDEAIKAIEQSRKAQDSEEAWVVLSMVYFETKDFSTAVSFMEKALERAPDNAMHHFRLGRIRETAGDLERAIESFKMAMSQNPDLVEARIHLGLALKKLRRYDEALEVLEEAVKDLRKIDANVSMLQTALGEVYEAMAMLDYAGHSFKLAVKNNKKNCDAIAGLGRVLRGQGRLEEALELLADGAKRMPDRPALLLELGLAYKDFRLETQATETLTKAVELDEDLTAAYRPLIELLDKGGPSEPLFKALKAAAAAMPDDLEIQLRSGRAGYRTKKYDIAIAAYRRALEIEPANIDANFYLGMSQVGAGDLDGAAESLGALKYLDQPKAEELARAIERGHAGATKPTKTKKKGKRRRRRRR